MTDFEPDNMSDIVMAALDNAISVTKNNPASKKSRHQDEDLVIITPPQKLPLPTKINLRNFHKSSPRKSKFKSVKVEKVAMASNT